MAYSGILGRVPRALGPQANPRGKRMASRVILAGLEGGLSEAGAG